MTFASQITRCPIPHDAEAGAEAARGFADLTPDLTEVLEGAAGCSPYLRGLMAREADWLRAALDADPATVAGDLNEAVRLAEAKDIGTTLRQAKGRLALFAGLADLAGVWPLEQVTGALTEFADLSVQAALSALLAPDLARGRFPGQGPDDLADAAGMVVLAMGKMGAHELNYSSDIDLICLFDDSRYDDADVGTARAAFVKVVRRVTSVLSDITGDGYVWRTDLRLRPDPSVTPIVLSMYSAERYYESLGRTWERAAHIKARPCAGDLEAGARYLETLRPFVWRRHLDFAAVQDAHDIRQRIRSHKGLYETAALEGRDLKLSPGGIREIEFFTQTRQLIAGGRDPDLRLRGTVPALKMLADKGWVDEPVAAALSDHYRALREVEHRVQMVADARTHALPGTPEGFDRIARMCGIAETQVFRRDLSERIAAVMAEAEGFFSPGPAPQARVPEPEIVKRWRHYPALRSARAQEIFERVKPDLLARLAAASHPEQALTAFDGFLAGLPAGVQLFSMFDANPQLRALIADIAGTAPALARYLARNSGVLDAVIGGDFFAPWPGVARLAESLERVLGRAEDYEAQLDAARRWQKDWHFRIGVHHLRGLVDAAEAGTQYAELAEAAVRQLYPVVVRQLSVRHGTPPGQGATVLGMGSLGAGWLNARSDLDLILIYDAPGDAESDGRRPLAARAYYAKLTQALVTALSAATAEGRLYEVDMRLRPSGRQGPVATGLAAFGTYQRTEAWTWEHLALTRARPVAGDPQVGQAVCAIRDAVLAEPHDRAQVLADVAEMRVRLNSAKAPTGPLDLKAGPGGLREIELIGQMAALLGGDGAQGTEAQLAMAGDALGLEAALAEGLTAAYVLQRSVFAAGRLLLDADPGPSDRLASGARDMMLRDSGAPDLDTMLARLSEVRQSADAAITAALATAPSGEMGEHPMPRTGKGETDEG